jgi:hypothetical protein
MSLNQCIYIFYFYFFKREKMYIIPNLHFKVKIHRLIIQWIPKQNMRDLQINSKKCTNFLKIFGYHKGVYLTKYQNKK